MSPPLGDPRERSFKLVLSEEEHAMLTALSGSDGLSAASWLRQRIRAEWWDRHREHLGAVARQSGLPGSGSPKKKPGK